jgi:hypothetical protein
VTTATGVAAGEELLRWLLGLARASPLPLSTADTASASRMRVSYLAETRHNGLSGNRLRTTITSKDTS